MKKCASFVVALTCGLLSAGTVAPAFAQPLLDRIEQSIRNRAATDAKTDRAAAKSAKAKADNKVVPASGQQAADVDNTGYLGVVSDDKNDRGRGVRVTEVRQNSPAAAADIKVNDLITAVAGVRIRQMADLKDVLDLYPAGSKIDIDLLRDNSAIHTSATLTQRPAALAAAARSAGPTPTPAVRPSVPEPPPAVLETHPTVPPPPELLDEPSVTGPQLVPSAPVERSVNRPDVEQSQIKDLIERIEQLESRVQKLEKSREKDGDK
jgi:hypothetical protein